MILQPTVKRVRHQGAPRGFRRFFSGLGPGLITGAADDDPWNLHLFRNRRRIWTLAALDRKVFISIDDRGADDVRATRPSNRPWTGRRHSPPISQADSVGRLYAARTANTVNIGADLGGMAKANSLPLTGDPILAPFDEAEHGISRCLAALFDVRHSVGRRFGDPGARLVS